MKTWIKSNIRGSRLFYLFGIASLVFVVAVDSYANINTSKSVIQNEIFSFVNTLVNGSTAVSEITWIFWFFTFLLVTKNLFFYITKSLDAPELVTDIIYFFFALILLTNFDWYTKVLWEYSSGVAF